MMKARTIGSLTPGSSASACRSRSAGTSRISLSSALPRALASAAVPVSIPTSPMKSRGPAVARICSCPSRDSNDFHLAAQDDDERKIALSRFEDQLAAPHFPPRAQRLQHGELPVVEFRKGDALRVAVELLVCLVVGHGRSCKPLARAGHRLSLQPTGRRSYRRRELPLHERATCNLIPMSWLGGVTCSSTSRCKSSQRWGV